MCLHNYLSLLHRYGSDDGCKTIHNQLPELEQLIRQVAHLLYLKPHVVCISIAVPITYSQQVGSGMNNEPMRLDFPADVEGHLGTDGRYYLVDVHRLFPAEREFLTSYAVLIPANMKVRHFMSLCADSHRRKYEFCLLID